MCDVCRTFHDARQRYSGQLAIISLFVPGSSKGVARIGVRASFLGLTGTDFRAPRACASSDFGLTLLRLALAAISAISV